MFISWKGRERKEEEAKLPQSPEGCSHSDLKDPSRLHISMFPPAPIVQVLGLTLSYMSLLGDIFFQSIALACPGYVYVTILRLFKNTLSQCLHIWKPAGLYLPKL